MKTSMSEYLPSFIGYLRSCSVENGVETLEQLSDASGHFQLFYGSELNRMTEWEAAK